MSAQLPKQAMPWKKYKNASDSPILPRQTPTLVMALSFFQSDMLTSFVFFFLADATWLSTNFGVIICIECSGIHREMGVHITKIQSLTLDNIGTSQLLVSRVMTNDAFNKVMEATVNANGNAGKIKPSSTM